MPKKTKEQKIHAASRKSLLYQHLFQDSKQEKKQTNNLNNVGTLRHNVPTNVYGSGNPTPTDSFFFHDLKKSLLVIGSIITLEIILYFVSMNKYLASILQ